MKAALASLNLPPHQSNGLNVVFDEDDEDDRDDYSSAANGQDVWDFISDEDADGFYSSDLAEVDRHAEHGDDAKPYGAAWLVAKCSGIAARNGLAPDVFQSQIIEILSSGRSEDALQSQLTDLIGFDDLDFVVELLSHRGEITAAVASQGQQEPTGRRLLSKAQRDEALHRQDLEHKTATLSTSVKREENYPHVYKAYNAGNTLSYTGSKYALPQGSKHEIFAKYEEHSIPAGKKGVPGPGERLVKISELDGLCRKTFKGYKALNRMQSLVYPVGYKTNENLLICAPTGAVSRGASRPVTGQKRLTISGQNGRSHVNYSSLHRTVCDAQPR
jgi:antiviral helicase SLH1